MRVRLDNIATQVAAFRQQAGPSPETGTARVRVASGDPQSAPLERRPPARSESRAADTRIGKALELRLCGQVLVLSRAAVNAQAAPAAEVTPRLRVVAEEIRGLAARAASGTLTDRERVTIERKMRTLERELGALTAYQRLVSGATASSGQPTASPMQQVAQSAVADIGERPSDALAAQANLTGEAVLGHLWA